MKNKFKKLLIIIGMIVIVVPLYTYAQDTRTTGGANTRSTSGSNSGQPTFTLQNPLSNNLNSVGSLVNKFVEIFSYLVILFAVIMLIWTGLQYIVAQGNSERLKELTKRLTWILIGIAIVIGARIMVMIIINTLQATGTVNQQTLQSVNNAVSGN